MVKEAAKVVFVVGLTVLWVTLSPGIIVALAVDRVIKPRRGR